jgi:hypothetical protein
MMLMSRRANPQPLPLLDWPEQVEIARLQARREQLAARIAALPRYSHKRIELETRLRIVTARQLRMEQELRGMP